MASIIEEFGKELGHPCDAGLKYLPYDQKSKSFDISSARTHYEFQLTLAQHKTNIEETVREMNSVEKQMGGCNVATEETDSCDTSTGNSNRRKQQEGWQKMDGQFKRKYEAIQTHVWEANRSTDRSVLPNYIESFSRTRSDWEDKMDHFGRHLIHKAVQDRDTTMVKVFLSAGCNVNAQEGCGATPIVLAVLNKDTEMCKLLLNNCADFREEFFVKVPSPMEIASVLGLEDVLAIFKEVLHSEYSLNEKVLCCHQGQIDENSPVCATSNCDDGSEFVYDRRTVKPILFAGDQLTCKNIRSVRQKSRNAYGWTSEIPGDMHTLGYLCEM